jgi:hypothetical protein
MNAEADQSQYAEDDDEPVVQAPGDNRTNHIVKKA